MNRLLPLLFLGISFILLNSSCASMKQGKWLDEHYMMLDQAANSNIAPEKKMDVLGASFTKMMKQGLAFTNPKKGGEYVSKYAKRNEENIDKILQSMNAWQADMSTVDKVSAVMKMKNKSYTKDMIDLYPKFRRKYKQIAFVAKLTGKVGKGMAGVGGRLLQGMFKD